MAWTSPMTAVANSAFTAAQFNTHVRDNLLETAPGRATQSGSYFVGTGVNAIAERTLESANIATAEDTTSTSYTNLATPGPSVTVTTGAAALVFLTCDLRSSSAGQTARASIEVSGDTSITADDGRCLKFQSAGANDSLQASFASVFTLTPGSNTFTMKYRSQIGTSTANFRDRRLIVMAF